MSATVGLKLLSALVSTGDIQQFIKLNLSSDLFRESEAKVYSFITNHIQKYGKIPNTDTVISKLGEVIVEVTEPAEYYLAQVETRYLHTSIKSLVIQAGDYLKDEEPEVAYDMLLKGVSAVHAHSNRNNLVDFRDVLEALIPEYFKIAKTEEELGIMFGWPHLDSMTGGLKPGDVASICGRPACLGGTAKIYVARKGNDGSGRRYTLEQLYRGMNGLPIKFTGKGSGKKWDLAKPTKAQCLMGDITGLNLVEQVIKCGVKETWTITTESGFTTRTTLDHMFLTEGSVWKELRDIRNDDYLVVKAPKITTVSNYKPRKEKEIYGHFYDAPYSTKTVKGITYHRVIEHRAVFDAALNNLPLQKFIEGLRTNPEHGFIFAPMGMHIHHVDHDHSNNSPDNLEALTNSEHGKEHAKGKKSNKQFGLNEVMLDRVVSIIYYGEEETYDLVMADPHNNFIADGFVTHNSGKTFMGLNSAHHAWKQNKKVLFVSMEMTNQQITQRLAALHSGINLTHLIKAMLSTPSFDKMMYKLNKVKAKETPFWLVDGNLTATVDDIIMLSRQLKPDTIYIDGAYLLRHPNPKISRFERITDNAESIKSKLATDLGIPVTSSYQFNRGSNKKKGDKAGLDDIYGTDAIAQLSTIVMGLFEVDSVDTEKFRQIEILKGRNGESGDFTIHWDFNNMNFSEVVKEETNQMQFIQ